MSAHHSRVFTTEFSTPEMEVVASQLTYLKSLNQRNQKEQRRVTEARRAIPQLQNLLLQRRVEINSFSGVLTDLMGLQVQQGEASEGDWENPFLLPALNARVDCGRLTLLTRLAKEYCESLSDSKAIIENQIESVQSVISASAGVLARMQVIRSTMLESVRLQYGLIHPIHLLSSDILAYIFSLILRQKFETIRMFRGRARGLSPI